MVASVSKFTPLALALLSGQVLADSYYTGDGTAYTLGATSAGNCNMMSALSFASTNYAAINAAQWNDMKNCGRCAEVSCIDDSCADKSTTQVVQILDQCPECSEGDLDLSPTVFETITGSTPSRLKIQWRFVDCPVSGNVQYCLKSGSNNFWTAVQPANTVNGVASMTINSQSTTMVSSAYYYLLNGNSQAQVDLTALTISLTSTSGEVLTDTVSLTDGACTSGKYQFGSSGNTASQSATQTTTAPATTAPATTAPATTAPATTAPATTAPATTAPATTAPATTAPATTAPATTSPATTSPATTAPATTASPTTSPAPTTATPSSTPVPSATTAKPTQSSAQQSASSNSTSSITQSEADSDSTPSPSPSPTTAKPKSTPTPTTAKPSSTTHSSSSGTSGLTFTSIPAATTAAPTSSSSSTPAPDQETQTANTQSEGSSSTSPAVIALAMLGAVGVVALAVIVAVSKKKKIENKDAMETPMDFCAVMSAGNHLDNGRTPRPNRDVAIL